MNKLFGDLKTDEEKSNFFLSGRGYETGVIAAAIQNDVAMAYHRCAEYKKELAALQAARTEAVQGEPVELDRYDAVFLGGQDGMPAYVWHDIIRAELDRAYDFYMDQLDRATPQPAPDVSELVDALDGAARSLETTEQLPEDRRKRKMSDYKLVPVRPTPEMCHAAEAALDDDQSWPAIWEEILDVAPDVQGEPVGWHEGYRAAMKEAGRGVRELYVNHQFHEGARLLLDRCRQLEQSFIKSAEAAPQPAEQQPAPDVEALVEALEEISQSCDSGRHDGLPEDGPALSDVEAWLVANDALDAHRKGGEV